MDPIRRNILATGRSCGDRGSTRIVGSAAPPRRSSKLYDQGNVRIRHQEIRLRLSAVRSPRVGGLNSRISNRATAVIDAMREPRGDFRCTSMDQRNATGDLNTESAVDTNGVLSPMTNWG